jgi:hypothetical protein
MSNQGNHVDPHNVPEEMRQGITMAVISAAILCRPLAAYMRVFGSCGEKYFGGWAALGWVIMPCFCLFYPREDVTPMIWFFLLTGLMFIGHRFQGAVNRRKGMVVHSNGDGDSRLASVSADQAYVKQTVEAGVAILAGVLGCAVSSALGSWLIVSGLAHGFWHGWQQDRENAIVREQRDRMLEMEYMEDLMRRGGNYR